MDINDLRVATEVISLALFIGIMAWTWSRQRKTAFDEAAALPFKESDGEQR